MRKFYLLLVVALLATSSAFADITYELNGGQPNPYGWTSKEDLFNAFMADAGVTLTKTYNDYVGYTNPYTNVKDQEPGNQALGALLTTNNIVIPYAMPKWTWLLNYIQSVTKLGGVSDNTAKWRFYTAQFLLARGDSPAYAFDFTEAGKDEAYLPAWEYCYAFPTTVTETTKLKKPWKENCTFAGWYTTADFSGNPITTIDANTTGTLYAKWINNVLYELNGGAWNPYGWTSKEDLFNAFMEDAGVTEYKTIAEYKALDKGIVENNIGVDGLHGGLCAKLDANKTKAAYANTAKWGWLESYVKKVFEGTTFTYDETRPQYPVGAFFICGQSLSFPKSPSYAEAGKDEAYFKDWGYSYGNPSIVEGEYTLKNPYREGAWEFAGWYKNAECTGEPTTTINADFAGTLYAKWNSVREGITYDLNGGSNIINNPYGWKSKSDLFDAFMADAGVTLKYTYEEYVKADNPYTNPDGKGLGNQVLGVLLNASNIGTPYSNTAKWGWLLNYIKDVTGIGDITGNEAAWRFYTAQFLLAGGDSPAFKFDFTEAGKDEAYFKAWKHSYELINPKFPEENVTLYAAEKEGCTFQGWYDNRWFTGEAVTTVGATTNGTLYAHWSSIMGSKNTTLNTLHTHYFDGTYVYASTIATRQVNTSATITPKATAKTSL